MTTNEIIALPLTAKGVNTFARLRRRYQISNSQILELLLEHVGTLSPPHQKRVIRSVFALEHTEVFPADLGERPSTSQ
jgi:hypothetical protein